ncbi:hypothetical protein GQ44DRAFT_725887 [Phaeosphaeriaceae sp. PMI808]|nr:hypothetical protein GQ44DRAFT_725887 [Phaeosphaeriaceae sp. PMI808]
MAISTKNEFVINPQSDDIFSYDIPNISRHQYKSWNGWAIGAYVHVWLPANSTFDLWRNYPVLLVDVRKCRNQHTQFIVAHLYDQHATTKRFMRLTGLNRWRASKSLKTWPTTSTYVLSNHFELVYEWELRTWSRPAAPAIATHWLVNVCDNQLQRWKIQRTTDLGRALQIITSFSGFLKLPCEIRHIIYRYALIDEVQKTSHSRIYTNRLVSQRLGVKEERFGRSGPGLLPRLQTPGILRVCQQIRTEALDNLYRTKILAIAITPRDYTFDSLNQDWLPDLSRFLHMRIDLTLDESDPSVTIQSISAISRMFQGRDLSFQFLQIIVAFPKIQSLPRLSKRTVTKGIQCLVPLLDTLVRKSELEYKALNISWGVTDDQKKVGDYSCAYNYLCGNSLQHAWSVVYGKLSSSGNNTPQVFVQVEDCQSMGCKVHSSRQSKLF